MTEHFHCWTKNNPVNSALQPQFFVEISEELAAEKKIEAGGWVRVWNKRGSVFAKALVTKRIRPLICDGQMVHVIGIPLHWGFIGAAKKGFGPNSLTPFSVTLTPIPRNLAPFWSILNHLMRRLMQVKEENNDEY